MSPASCTDPSAGNLLAGYELGALTDEECARFEAHVRGCETCLEALYETAPEMAVLRGHPEEVISRWRVHARAVGDEASSVVPSSVGDGASAASPAIPAVRRPGPRSRIARSMRMLKDALGSSRHSYRFWLPAGAMATAAVIAVVLFGGRGISYRGLALVEPLPYTHMSLRGPEMSERERDFREGMEAYNAGDHATAARILERAVAGADEAWRQGVQARLYLGVSLLLSNRPSDALPHLQRVKTSSLRAQADRASWYLAQAFLLMEDPARALAELEPLAAGGSSLAEPAARQIEAIKK
ncbi:MAG: zf-HC2 domain-containing protein [Candidatus Eisenbacteria bacterium]